jgi:hypothetical protein
MSANGATLSNPLSPRCAMALWASEIRKREFGDLWAEEGTLDLVREAMAVLLRIIQQLTGDDVSLKDIASPLALKALRMSHSVLGEFASQYNPNYEKY